MIRTLAVALLVPLAVAAQSVPEPEDYRTDHYRAPVPAEITGGFVVGPDEAHALWQAGEAVFIDVLPRPPKPANLPEGTIWREKPRFSIPGALWLPNVGYGRIADVTADYLKRGLETSTGNDLGHPVVFFCLEDCWMSWNAAKLSLIHI